MWGCPFFSVSGVDALTHVGLYRKNMQHVAVDPIDNPIMLRGESGEPGTWYLQAKPKWRQPVKDWQVYLVRCVDQSLYCGITNDLKSRIEVHNAGKGAKYTRGRLPVELVGATGKMTKSDALKFEMRVKKCAAGKKLSLLEKGVVEDECG